MTRTINIKSIEKATGKSWDEWITFLEKIQAHQLSHKEIAEKLAEQDGVSGWWAQTITVAYEQHIGRRKPGQTSDGRYQVSVSKTVKGTMDEALNKWLQVVNGRQNFSDVALTRTPTTSQSDTFRYWHCGLSDGSRVSLSIYQKAPDKAVLGLGHEKLKSQDLTGHWRTYWKSLLEKI